MTDRLTAIHDRIKATLQKNEKDIICNLKEDGQWKLNQETKNINEVLK